MHRVLDNLFVADEERCDLVREHDEQQAHRAHQHDWDLPQLRVLRGRIGLVAAAVASIQIGRERRRAARRARRKRCLLESRDSIQRVTRTVAAERSGRDEDGHEVTSPPSDADLVESLTTAAGQLSKIAGNNTGPGADAEHHQGDVVSRF